MSTDTKNYIVNVNIPVLSAADIEKLEICADGLGAMHKHKDAFARFDWTDDAGNRYTGNMNVQVQSVGEVAASKKMGKDKGGKRIKFSAANHLADKARRQDAANDNDTIDE